MLMPVRGLLVLWGLLWFLGVITLTLLVLLVKLKEANQTSQYKLNS